MAREALVGGESFKDLGKSGLSAAHYVHEGINFCGNWILRLTDVRGRVKGWRSRVLEGGSLELVEEFELFVRARERGTREDLREEVDPLAEDEAEDRDRDDLEVLEVWRGLEISGRVWREDSWVVEFEEVRAGVSGGSAAGLLPLWSIFEVTETHEEGAESREGRTYRLESQSTS